MRIKRWIFDLGTRVKVPASDGTAFYATITDRLYSNATGKWMYRLKYDGSETASAALYEQDQLEEAKDEVTWSYDITLAKDVVVAVLTERVGDEEPKVIGRGHGHIIHDGVGGFAQAASYALRRIWEDLDPNNKDRRSGNEIKAYRRI